MANSRSSARTVLLVFQVGIIANLWLVSSAFTPINHEGLVGAGAIASIRFQFRADGLVTSSSNKPSSPALRSHPGKQQAVILYGASSTIGPAISTDRFDLGNKSSRKRFTSGDRFVQPDTRAPPIL